MWNAINYRGEKRYFYVFIGVTCRSFPNACLLSVRYISLLALHGWCLGLTRNLNRVNKPRSSASQGTLNARRYLDCKVRTIPLIDLSLQTFDTAGWRRDV